MSPVDLALFAREDMKGKKNLLPSGTQTSDYTPQLDHAAEVTAVPDHLKDSRGAQPRVSLQRFSYELEIGIC